MRRARQVLLHLRLSPQSRVKTRVHIDSHQNRSQQRFFHFGFAPNPSCRPGSTDAAVWILVASSVSDLRFFACSSGYKEWDERGGVGGKSSEGGAEGEVVLKGTGQRGGGAEGEGVTRSHDHISR